MLRIRLKLLGTLRAKTPAEGRLELPEGARIRDVLAVLELHEEQVQAIAVNGAIEHDHSRPLAMDDELTVLPPVSGGTPTRSPVRR